MSFAYVTGDRDNDRYLTPGGASQALKSFSAEGGRYLWNAYVRVYASDPGVTGRVECVLMLGNPGRFSTPMSDSIELPTGGWGQVQMSRLAGVDRESTIELTCHGSGLTGQVTLADWEVSAVRVDDVRNFEEPLP